MKTKCLTKLYASFSCSFSLGRGGALRSHLHQDLLCCRGLLDPELLQPLFWTQR